MAKRKKERIGVISSMDQFRFAADRMHYEMQKASRQGSGPWLSRTGRDRRSLKRGVL